MVEAEGEAWGVLDDVVDAVAVGDDGAGVGASMGGLEVGGSAVVDLYLWQVGIIGEFEGIDHSDRTRWTFIFDTAAIALRAIQTIFRRTERPCSSLEWENVVIFLHGWGFQLNSLFELVLILSVYI